MVRTYLEGQVQIAPAPDGGRTLVIHSGPNVQHVVPLSREILAALAMSEEEMQAEAVRMEAQARRQKAPPKLVVPAGSVNGNGRH